MEMARILVAMSNDTSTSKLRAILIENGYTVIDHARDGHECLRKMRALKPDLVILDYNLQSMNGCEVARVTIEDKISDVILIINDAEKSLVDEIKSDSGFVCLTKPLNKPGLINTIELMVKNKRKIRELEREIESLRATLDTRKDVEKAKGLLMKNLNLSESEAFKRIQKQSMDRGIPMREIAKAIILAYDI
ncbi:MAG: ANTAR domain-containing protein [Clostridia bacterium]|nr:ANTAR domain-containing protein [Clostridia bacterium]